MANEQWSLGFEILYYVQVTISEQMQAIASPHNSFACPLLYTIAKLASTVSIASLRPSGRVRESSGDRCRERQHRCTADNVIQ